MFRQTNVLAKFDSSSKIRKSPNEENPNNKPSQISLDWFCWENLQETHGFLPWNIGFSG